MRKHLILIPFLLALSCGTSKKVETMKPLPNYGSGVEYQKVVSYINTPIEISVSYLENIANQYLTGLLYDQNNLNADNLAMKVWKQGPIKLQENNGNLQITLPLKVWSKVRYGFEKLGVKLYDIREINFSGNIKLAINVQFDNWKLRTSTQLIGIDWVEPPSILVAGNKIPVTLLVNPALNLFKNKISKLIDETIANNVNIKTYVTTAMEQISKPIEINKDFHLNFAMQPLEIYATKTKVEKGKINIAMGIKAYMETAINQRPTLMFDKSKLLLSNTDNIKNDFVTAIPAWINYADASNIMKANFNGKVFSSGKNSVTVNNVDLWGRDGKMIVALNMSGFINGDFYLAGQPEYDPTKKEIYLSNVDFVLDSKNKLAKLADWLAHGIVLKKIEQNCHFPIGDKIKTAEDNAKAYLKSYQPINGVTVSGSLNQLTPTKINLSKNAIIAWIEAKGNIGITMNGWH